MAAPSAGLTGRAGRDAHDCVRSRSSRADCSGSRLSLEFIRANDWLLTPTPAPTFTHKHTPPIDRPSDSPLADMIVSWLESAREPAGRSA